MIDLAAHLRCAVRPPVLCPVPIRVVPHGYPNDRPTLAWAPLRWALLRWAPLRWAPHRPTPRPASRAVFPTHSRSGHRRAAHADGWRAGSRGCGTHRGWQTDHWTTWPGADQRRPDGHRWSRSQRHRRRHQEMTRRVVASRPTRWPCARGPGNARLPRPSCDMDGRPWSVRHTVGVGRRHRQHWPSSRHRPGQALADLGTQREEVAPTQTA